MLQVAMCNFPTIKDAADVAIATMLSGIQVVRFRSLERPKDDEFSLELLKLFTYDDVVERVARHFGLEEPSKIRLTSHNCYSQQLKPQPTKYRGVEHLSDMLVHYNQTSDILYYEILDIPLPELQGLKTLKVAFHPATEDEVMIYNIRLPKNSTEADVINDLKTKIFPPSEKIENINDQYWTLSAEEWNYAFMSLGRPEYLQDSDVIASRFQSRRDFYGAWEQYLGLEHSDTAPKRAYTANQD